MQAPIEFPPLVRAELNLEMPDRVGYVEIVRRWLDDGSRLLAGDLRREMEEKPPPPRQQLGDGRIGWPHAASGGINLHWDVRRISTRDYKPGSLDRLLNQLQRADEWPFDVGISFSRLDNQGRMVFGRAQSVVLGVRRQDPGTLGKPGPMWLQLDLVEPDAKLFDISRQEQWLDLLRPLADDLNPSFGLIDLRYPEGDATALELAIGPPWRIVPLDGVPESRQVLRGYGWLTILAQELVERLGGASALEATGAFYEVRQLSKGGVWLLATEHYRDYNQAAVEKVFRAVAPVVRPGRPSRTAMQGPPFRIVYEDAAEVSRS